MVRREVRERRKEGRREESWPSLLLFTCIETGREVVGGVVTSGEVVTGGKVKEGKVKVDPGGGKNAYIVKHPLTVHDRQTLYMIVPTRTYCTFTCR